MTNYHIKEISDVLEGLINNGIYSEKNINKEINKLEWISKKLNNNIKCDYILVRTDNFDYINIENYKINFKTINFNGSFKFVGKLCNTNDITFLIEFLNNSIYLFFKNEEEALLYKNIIDNYLEARING